MLQILLEEIHRQFLEGECEPKKRLKSLNDVKKKKPVNAASGAQPMIHNSHNKQQDNKQEIAGV